MSEAVRRRLEAEERKLLASGCTCGAKQRGNNVRCPIHGDPNGLTAQVARAVITVATKARGGKKLVLATGDAPLEKRTHRVDGATVTVVTRNRLAAHHTSFDPQSDESGETDEQL